MPLASRGPCRSFGPLPLPLPSLSFLSCAVAKRGTRSLGRFCLHSRTLANAVQERSQRGNANNALQTIRLGVRARLARPGRGAVSKASLPPSRPVGQGVYGVRGYAGTHTQRGMCSSPRRRLLSAKLARSAVGAAGTAFLIRFGDLLLSVLGAGQRMSERATG